MRLLSIILFSIFLFTGCANLNTPANLKKTKSEKTDLINKANNGDIKAMLELNKTYLFPETKEGLSFFNKWYDLVLKSDNAKEILAFAKIFNERKYNNMFINGDKRYIDLLNRAAKLGENDALFSLLKVYAYEKDKKEKIYQKILKNATQKDINRLYIYFIQRGLTKKIDELEKFMVEKKIELSTLSKYHIAKSIFYKKNKKGMFYILFDEILKSKDKEALIQTAKLIKYKMPDKALMLMKKAIEADTKDIDTYLIFVKMHKKDKDNKLVIKYLKEASLLDSYEATKQLLSIYRQDIKYIDEYFALKTQLEDKFEAKRALADFYYITGKKNLANKLLDKLAEQNNIEAILSLATRYKAKYTYSPDELKVSKKWQNFILNSNNPALISKLKKAIGVYSNLTEIKEKLLQKEIENSNIITLRSLYAKYRKKNPLLSQKYLLQAVEAGDVYSNLELAKKYIKTKDLKEIKKAIKIYEKLAKKSDLDALIFLGMFYTKPPKGAKELKDLKKSVSYYKKAIALEDKDGLNLKIGDYNGAIYELAKIYICGECNKKENDIISHEKAITYVNMLAKLGKARDISYLAWIYYSGKMVKKDLKKAIEFFNIAGENGYAEAYYTIALIYEKSYKDYKKALKYLQKGAKLKNSSCINLLGKYYEKGKGVKQDINKAIKYYKQISLKNKYATYNLAKIYYKEQDYEKAMIYFEQSAKQGIIASYVELGIMYEKGYGEAPNIKKALEYYKKAYEYNKGPEAAFNIGLIYQYGKGEIKIDLKEAKKWYERSALKIAKKQIEEINKGTK